MIEKYKESLEQEGEYTAILMDLSKAFDCLPRDLIIAKLCTYRFGIASFRLTHSHLTGSYQRVEINNSYSYWNLRSNNI